MKEDTLALKKAVNSGDTDLSEPHHFCYLYISISSNAIVYHVLLHLHKRLPLGTFFRIIEEGGPPLLPASKLLQVYAREQDREMLRDFYYSEDRRVDSAILCLEEAHNMTVGNLMLLRIRKFNLSENIAMRTGSVGENNFREGRSEILFRRQRSCL